MKTGISVFILIILFAVKLHAQLQVVSSAGNFHSTSSGSVSWTLGELAIQTFTVTGFVLTQGFQQGSLTVTSVGDIPDLDFKISAFPNPAQDYITIRTDRELNEQLYYQLYDLTGKIIMQDKLRENETQISVGHLKASVYLLRIIDGGRQVRTFKIVKQ